MIAKGFGFAAVSELLKGLYVEEAERHFRIADKRMTESRLSLLTGLRRREVKRLREEGPRQAGPITMGPAPRVLARWATSSDWCDVSGTPLRLPIRSETGPSFEALAAEISRDIHPRSVLDALVSANTVRLESDGQSVTLMTDAYLPRDEATQMAYLWANIGDHTEAAVANVLASGDGPFFERAAHFNKLTEMSLAELETMARDVQEKALNQIAEAAEAAQCRDADAPNAKGRFRAGAFVFSAIPGGQDTK